jgi:predicted enzyme related to lactoylglutathione lyase
MREKRCLFSFYHGVFLLGVGLLAGCSCLTGKKEVKPEGLPSITQAPTGQFHLGKIIWHDLLTSNPDRAKGFYEKLFGWEFRAVRSRYTEIYFKGRKLGGMLQIDPKEGREPSSMWLVAFSEADIEGALKRLKAGGGTLLRGPTDWGDRGEGVLISDSSGAHSLLMHAKGGDPEDRNPEMGEWLWNELWTLQMNQDALFYNALIPYSDSEKDAHYVVLLNEGKWRVGIRQIKEKAFAGRWIPVIRVADPLALQEKVERLGGKSWVPSPKQQKNGNTLLISDPDGALVILQKWDFSEEAEEVQP